MLAKLRNLVENFLDKIWYTEKKNFSFSLKLCYLVLRFFSFFYLLVIVLRKKFYKLLYKKNKYKAKIWVVGNLTVGGNGKSILVGYLAKFLAAKGYKIAIVSKGYNRKSKKLIQVNSSSLAHEVGDEPLMLYYQTQSIVVVANDRSQALNYLNDNFDLDIILCDDGLQDYTISYDKKFVVINNNRLFGNRSLLPSGPLREPLFALNFIDAALIINFNSTPITTLDIPLAYKANVSLDKIYNLSNPKIFMDETKLEVNIVTAVADYKRFTFFVKNLGFKIKKVKHFSDHYFFDKTDFDEFHTNEIILMSEKDAVKCKNMHPNIWVVAIKIMPEERFIADFL